MAIFNYTTAVPYEKSVQEIIKMLSNAKAVAVLQEYENGLVTHIAFKINTAHGLMAFRLPANLERGHAVLNKTKGVERRYRTQEHAARVAWRIVKDWVRAQLAIIETEMVTLTQIFLPFAQDAAGHTVYEQFEKHGFMAITYQPEKK